MESFKKAASRSGKLGLLSTYNQDWAMTQYVDRMLELFGPSDVVVLAEQASAEALPRTDGPQVHRVWHRSTPDYSSLEKTIIEQEVGLLQVNCAFPYFDSQHFQEFLASIKARGVGVAFYIQEFDGIEISKGMFGKLVDYVFVDNALCKMSVLAHGVDKNKVFVLPIAVSPRSFEEKSSIRRRIGMAETSKIVTTFSVGGRALSQDSTIDAMYALRERSSDLHLYVLEIGVADAQTKTKSAMKQRVDELHLGNYVHFIDIGSSDSRVRDYVSAADVVVTRSDCPIYQAREVLFEAIGRGTPIVHTGRLCLDGLQGSTFAAADGVFLQNEIGAVLDCGSLRDELNQGASIWAADNSAEGNANSFRQLYRNLLAQFKPASSESTVFAGGRQSPALVRRRLKILMQNRDNALSNRGGDTVVMEKVAAELAKLGHHVDIDVQQQKRPRDYDLVHLYNFAIREQTENMARRCHSEGVPYVVTTLYEDWPVFFNQMAKMFFALKSYVEGGQPRERWQELRSLALSVEPAAAWDNSWAANHAEALLASGTFELNSLRRDYPNSKRIDIIPFGCEVTGQADDGTLFKTATGIEDFVLCVGRLEWRKNQLMLLKALEDSDITVVFAAGGFTYQPEYAEACRAFKRRGKTVFLDRLEPQVLASAYSAARAHVLPSWFELPGLVSLEAAHYGTNIVVSDLGTISDYVGDLAYYCRPDDDQSILKAVDSAYHSPKKVGLEDRVGEFRWAKTARQTEELYLSVLDGKMKSDESVVSRSSAGSPQTLEALGSPFQQTLREASNEASAAQKSVARIPDAIIPADSKEGTGQHVAAPSDEARMCDEGDWLLTQGKYPEAKDAYTEVILHNKDFARAYRSLAVVFLQMGDAESADHNFRTALRLEPRDNKSLVGLGAVEWEKGNHEEAFELYKRAANCDPRGEATILHLLNAGYALNRVGELQQTLRNFIVEDPTNVYLQYCLAGCYFRLKKYGLANGIIQRILAIDSENSLAKELQIEIEKQQTIEGNYSTEDKPMSEAESQFTASTTDDVANVQQPLVAQLRRLETLKKEKKYDELVSLGETILSGEQGSVSQIAFTNVLIGEATACLGDVVAADSYFTKAISDPGYGYRACAGRAAIAASLEQWVDAKILFARSLELHADYDIALAGLAICAEAEGNYEEAWGYYGQSFASNSENLKALNGIIRLGYQLKRLEQTEVALRKYLEIHPADLLILYSLAGCLYAAGRTEESAEECQKVLLFDPNNELAVELLAKIEDGSTADQISVG